jgi:hypothetical protein
MSRVVLLLLTIVALTVPGCARDGAVGPNGESEGVIQVLLTDAPFPFDRVSSVDIYFVSIAASTTADSLSDDREWLTIAEPNQLFNLLELQGGITALVGEAELSVGTYEAVRVVIDVSQSSMTLADGSAAAVDWRGSGHMTLHTIVEDPLSIPVEGASIVIDFDVCRSFSPVGESFVFVPWIRAVNEAATGALAGTVHGRDGGDGALMPVPDASISVYPSANAVFSGAVPIASAQADENGEFLLPFLLNGSYTLHADPPSGFDAGRAIESEVVVAAGGQQFLGITLPTASDLPQGAAMHLHGPTSLAVGQTATYTAFLVGTAGDSVPAAQAEWHTSSGAVASITGTGASVTVTGVAEGSAAISASYDGVQSSIVVSIGDVANLVNAVEVSPETQTIAVGDSSYVQATVRDENGAPLIGLDVTWALSDPSVASLSHGGFSEFAVLWGEAPGTVTVTATVNGKSGSGTVIVN